MRVDLASMLDNGPILRPLQIRVRWSLKERILAWFFPIRKPMPLLEEERRSSVGYYNRIHRNDGLLYNIGKPTPQQ